MQPKRLRMRIALFEAFSLYHTQYLLQKDIFARLRPNGGDMAYNPEVEELRKEIKRLKLKINALVDFLNVHHLGPPEGRKPYDEMVDRLLRAEGLQD